MTNPTPEQYAPTSDAPVDETAPVVPEQNKAPAPATGAATFAAETPGHVVVPAGTAAPAPQPVEQTAAGQDVTPQPTADTTPESAPQPAARPGTLAEVENVTGDVSTVIRDARDGDVAAMIGDIHRMVTDMHDLISDVEPAVRKVVSEVETKGLPGLLSLFMGGGR